MPVNNNQALQLGPGDYGNHSSFARKAFFGAMASVAPEILVEFKDQVWPVILSSYDALGKIYPEVNGDLPRYTKYLWATFGIEEHATANLEPALARAFLEGAHRVYAAIEEWAKSYFLLSDDRILDTALGAIQRWAMSPDRIDPLDWAIEPSFFRRAIHPDKLKFEFSDKGWHPQEEMWLNYRPRLVKAFESQLTE